MRFLVLLFVPLALVAGIWLGGHSSSLPGPLRDFATDDDLAVVDTALERIHDDYLRDLPRDRLADDAIDGAVRGLGDEFSSYFDPREYGRFQEATEGRFSGVGLTVQRHPRGLRVVEVFNGSPAKRAGLRADDLVVAVDGASLRGKPEDASVARIKGRQGTTVALTITRGKDRFTRRLKREQIEIDVVKSERRSAAGKEFAVVELESFSSGAHAEVFSAVRRALKDEVDGLVFDLRGNGGGLVEEARLVASAFLEDGKIVTTRGRAVRERVYKATGDPVTAKLPMVVLVDRGSASASEIVAGALQDRKRAQLVGSRTFGKGVFQEVVELGNGGALDLTIGQYFLPSGRNIGGPGTKTGEGLKPDVVAADEQDTRRDEALDRALRVLAAR